MGCRAQKPRREGSDVHGTWAGTGVCRTGAAGGGRAMLLAPSARTHQAVTPLTWTLQLLLARGYHKHQG